MLDVTLTTTALLTALRDSEDQGAWLELDARYRPVIIGLARRLGLSHTDAEDVAQEVLARIVKHHRAGGYDRERGRLRSWIAQVARNCIADAHRSATVRRERRGESAFDQAPPEDEFGRLWERELRAAILQRALSELRTATRFDERTIAAFELVGLGGRPAAAVATDLEMTVESVYAAKSRCTKELRAIVGRLTTACEID
jgi:RNA polymerase sigma factor (sigma-70 family)